MIGEETAHLLNDPALIEVDLVAVKGKTEAGGIYTLPPEPGVVEQLIDRIRHCWAPIAGRTGRRPCACSTTAGSPQLAFWLQFTISTGGKLPNSRSRLRLPIGNGVFTAEENEMLQ